MKPRCLLSVACVTGGPFVRLICWRGRNLGNGSTKRAHTLLRIGKLTSLFATSSPMKTWLFGGRTRHYASPSLTSLSDPACAAQVSGSVLPAGIPGSENTSAGFICQMHGLYPQVCYRVAQSRGAWSADHPAPSIAPVPSSGAAGPLSGLEGDTLRVC